MSQINYLVSLVFLLVGHSSHDQQTLVGKWKETKVEIVGVDSADIPSWNGTKYEPFYLFEFGEKGTCIDFSFDPNGKKISYRVDGSMLHLGRLQFKIQTLNATELVLITHDPEWPENQLRKKHTFKRENSNP